MCPWDEDPNGWEPPRYRTHRDTFGAQVNSDSAAVWRHCEDAVSVPRARDCDEPNQCTCPPGIRSCREFCERPAEEDVAA